jgi:hypothetical protein
MAVPTHAGKYNHLLKLAYITFVPRMTSVLDFNITTPPHQLIPFFSFLPSWQLQRGLRLALFIGEQPCLADQVVDHILINFRETQPSLRLTHLQVLFSPGYVLAS